MKKDVFAMVAILLLMVILLARPAVRGYQITKEFDPTEISLTDLIKELKSAESQIYLINSSLIASGALLQECNVKLATQANSALVSKNLATDRESQLKLLKQSQDFNRSSFEKQCQDTQKTWQRLLDQTKTQLSELEQKYDEIIKNSANNICCKEKVDDKYIDSYIVFNSHIVCTHGSDKKIQC